METWSKVKNRVIPERQRHEWSGSGFMQSISPSHVPKG